MERYLIVVGRDRLSLCDYLRQQFFGNPEVRVILDRRCGERPRPAPAEEPDRSPADRRRGSTDEDLRTHGVAVVRRNSSGMNFTETEKLLMSLCTQLGVAPPGDAPANGEAPPPIPASPTERTPPVDGTGSSPGKGTDRQEPADPVKVPPSGEPPGALQANGFEPDSAEGRALLKKLGISGLRLPDKGGLCNSWLTFLQNEFHAWLDESVKIRPVVARARADGVRYLLIVPRDQSNLFFDRLRRDFAPDREVQVVPDRRSGERRTLTLPPAKERRRRRERRRQPEEWTVKLSHFYRGARPCVLTLAESPVAPGRVRRPDGSSFFLRKTSGGADDASADEKIE